MSVIIPAYNCASYLPEAIESALAQTYRPVEVIVVDDGSQDDTPALLASYGDRIVMVAQPNLGVSAARNAGIRRARGELLAFLDADDVWLPKKLALEAEALGKFPEAGFAFTDGEEFDGAKTIRPSLISEDHTPFREWRRRHESADRRWCVGRLHEELLAHNNYVCTSSVVVRKSALDRVGPFDEKLAMAEDYDLWLRLARAFPLVFVGEKTVRKRVRETSLCGPGEARLAFCRYHAATVAERHLSSLGAEARRGARPRIAARYLRAGWNYLHLERFREARAAFWGSVRTDPWQVRALLYLLVVTCVPRRAARQLRRVVGRLRGRWGSQAPVGVQ